MWIMTKQKQATEIMTKIGIIACENVTMDADCFVCFTVIFLEKKRVPCDRHPRKKGLLRHSNLKIVHKS